MRVFNTGLLYTSNKAHSLWHTTVDDTIDHSRSDCKEFSYASGVRFRLPYIAPFYTIVSSTLISERPSDGTKESRSLGIGALAFCNNLPLCHSREGQTTGSMLNCYSEL